MRVLGFPVPPFYENTWVVVNGSRAVVIDPGGDGSVLVDVLHGNKVTPEGVLLTHGHIDHISGLETLVDAFPRLNVWIHREDLKLYKNVKIQAKMFLQPVPRLPEPLFVEHGQILNLAGLGFQVLHTPGHSPGSVCYLVDSQEGKHLFTGDTLFYESVGRSDLWGGDPKLLVQSIKERLFVLPDETVCYPGHGPKTTIGHEKRYNPFLR